ncbi:required for meiotic nuclear division protein 1 homolog [Lepeophtheirus salmonis]|uniref:required for meiotic nuclear division protein 1 homolog n=1 Tax=Lepeophtheirus salmonis TaxID=72036 RepID=UPI001AE7A7A8|nr:required for meiotic nuclear division protein 1 homolog [Lepeophtheirus salmonis]
MNSIWRNLLRLSQHSQCIMPFRSNTHSSSSLRLPPLARRPHKTRPATSSLKVDTPSVIAYSTAGSYNLYDLCNAIRVQGLYEVVDLSDDLMDSVLSVKSTYLNTQKDIFFFAEKGSVVFWNVPEFERENVLQFLKLVEYDKYEEDVIRSEAEMLKVIPEEPNTKIKGGVVSLSKETDSLNAHLEKYSFSDAISASVKLGVLESSLHKLIGSIEHISDDLKAGRSLNLSRSEVLKKTGEVFALRHMINLSCDLLDTPDFYWDREKLEGLYLNTCSHLAVNKRTKIYNEKLNHCAELLELITAHLNDVHHVRLEWFIIILIMIEVGFECLHFIHQFIM